MSQIKRLIEHEEEQRRAATGIAIQAKALQVCMIHEDCVFEGSADPQNAYKLGNYKFTKDELKGVFDDRKEMTDAIKEAIEDNSGLDQCPICAKMMEE